MPFISTPQCVEVKLISSQNSVPVVNIWNVDVGAAVSSVNMAAVHTAFDSWLTSDYASIIQPSVLFIQWIITDVSVPNGTQLIFTPTTANGQATGAQSAANASVVASLRTAKTGRNFRGRTYVPGISQSVIVDAQHVSTGYAASVNTVFIHLITTLVTAGFKLSVLSRYLAKALRLVGVLTEVITIITDTKIDSQRRRTAN